LDYSYRRRELLPAVFAARSLGDHEVELGWFGSAYDWDYDAVAAVGDYERNDYIDKVKLGWTYVFGEKSRIHLSLSHVVRLDNFGGGNAQYLLAF